MIIHKWLEAIREYPNLKVTFDYLKKEYSFTINQLSEQTNELTKVGKELAKLKKQQFDKKEQDKFKEYITNKHPKKNISYLRHETDGSYQVDVRSFAMKDFAYPKFTGTNDQKMWRCLIWVIEHIQYKSDMTEYGKDEYWAYGYQTMKHKKGDCEDGAILLWNIALANKIPWYRLRLNAGDVKEPYGGIIGHAYVSYFRESDNEAIVCDWCYYPTYAKIPRRLTHKEERDYYEIWWSTDTQQSYGNKKYMGTMPKEVFEVVGRKV